MGSRNDREHDDREHDDREHDDREHDDREHDDREHDDREHDDREHDDREHDDRESPRFARGLRLAVLLGLRPPVLASPRLTSEPAPFSLAHRNRTATTSSPADSLPRSARSLIPRTRPAGTEAGRRAPTAVRAHPTNEFDARPVRTTGGAFGELRLRDSGTERRCRATAPTTE
ncbi:hypothetical protein [Halobaculum roseum]|uniref:Uncharacterized protein n=1 Tax=Halobaculum roseum TaxID=2175149 RepID=A0ABD5MLS6_9EURY